MRTRPSPSRTVTCRTRRTYRNTILITGSDRDQLGLGTVTGHGRAVHRVRRPPPCPLFRIGPSSSSLQPTREFDYRTVVTFNTLVVKVIFIIMWQCYFTAMITPIVHHLLLYNLVISRNFLYRFCAYLVNSAIKFQFYIQVIPPSLQTEKILSLDRKPASL